MTTFVAVSSLWMAMAFGLVAVHYVWRVDGGAYRVARIPVDDRNG